MLQKLHIQNYAIIDDIEIDFSKQLNIITGETGAGKSILMGALNLILGERADTSMLMKTDKKYTKCVETTGGNSLLNVVVDTVDTAQKVIQLIFIFIII